MLAGLQVFHALIFYASSVEEIARFRTAIANHILDSITLPLPGYSFSGTQERPFSPDLAKLIAPTLALNPHLRSVTLGGLTLRLDALREACSVRLHGPVAGVEGEPGVYTILASAGPGFTTSHALIASQLLSANPTLTALDLRGPRRAIKPPGEQALASAVRALPHLRTFDGMSLDLPSLETQPSAAWLCLHARVDAAGAEEVGDEEAKRAKERAEVLAEAQRSESVWGVVSPMRAFLLHRAGEAFFA